MASRSFAHVVSPRGIKVRLPSSSPSRTPRGALSQVSPKRFARAVAGAVGASQLGGLAYAGGGQVDAWQRLPIASTNRTVTDTPSALKQIAQAREARASIAATRSRLPPLVDQHALVTQRGYPRRIGMAGGGDVVLDRAARMDPHRFRRAHGLEERTRQPTFYGIDPSRDPLMYGEERAPSVLDRMQWRDKFGQQGNGLPETYPYMHSRVPAGAANEFTQRILDSVNGPGVGEQVLDSALGFSGVDPHDPSYTALGIGQLANRSLVPNLRGGALAMLLHSAAANAPGTREDFYRDYGKWQPYRPYVPSMNGAQP